MNPQDEAVELDRQLTQLEVQTAPASLAQALTRTGWVTEPWKPYAHLLLVNQKLLQLTSENPPFRKLLIQMPPQHGKSTLCSLYFPTWYLNRNPSKRIILASYNDDYARRWGRSIRELVKNNSKLLSINIEESASAADEWDLAGQAGGLKTTGVSGGVTGRGCSVLLIDDPIKDAAEASSLTIRDMKWEWWRSTIQSRLRRDAVVVLILTRWHHDDLAGRILEHESDQWEILSLPCLAEDDDPLGRTPGEPLCPELFPREEMVLRRESVGNQAWSSIYQQRPSPEGGGVFKKRDIRYWSAHRDLTRTYVLSDDDGNILVPAEECWRFATVDLALSKRETADYTVAAVWDVASWLEPSRLILVHVERERFDGAEHVPLLQRVWATYRPSFIGVESASFGAMTIRLARQAGLLVRELKVGAGSKKFRAQKDAAAVFENHRIYLPRHAPWMSVFEHELISFPSATHDDCVDVTAYACREFLTGMNLKGSRPLEPPPYGTLEELAWGAMTGKAGRKGYDHPVLGRLRG